MNYTDYMRVLDKPYWCTGSPLRWSIGKIGIGHFALDGRVGLFNLCWLMMQRSTPPTNIEAYSRADLSWVILLSGGVFIEGRSMEHHASIKELRDFRSMLKRFISRSYKNPVDFPGTVPWRTLYDLSTRSSAK